MAGRKYKSYQTSWDEIVPGLAHDVDGRWRIAPGYPNAGKKWKEPNEQAAVATAKMLLGIDRVATTTVAVSLGDLVPGLPGTTDALTDRHAEKLREVFNALAPVGVEEEGEGQGFADVKGVMYQRRWGEKMLKNDPPSVANPSEVSVRLPVPDAILYPWIAHQLANNATELGKRVGIPDLEARLTGAAITGPALRLSEIIKNYKTHNKATDKAKREAVKPLERLMEHADARTLAELTIGKLNAWKAHIEKTVPGPASRGAYYARVKSTIAFGLKTGMDPVQIRACLDRCKVLWTGESLPPVNPQPIAKEAFHELLRAANGAWRAWLLCGLNCCLHIDEVCGLKWDELDLIAGTYKTIRNKTRRQRIPRAATLWPETITTLKAIPRKGPYVFTSGHGTRFNKNGRVKNFADLRTGAGLSAEITFDCIRDGAYTAACNGAEERLARILAGHRSPGLQDNYVLRNPEIVRPACDAVYKAYGPF
jgi:integrase